MRRLVLLSLLLVMPTLAMAQSGNIPAVPEALNVLAERGAQMRYLGKSHGMDGWIAIYQGQETYYYVTPDGKGFVMGLLYDNEGKLVTIDQVASLQKEGGDVLDFLSSSNPAPDMNAVVAESNEAFQYKSPAERMFEQVEGSNYVELGAEEAPVIYSFMDPNCPHCHAFMEDLQADYIDKGLVRVRVIPVGFNPQSLAQAAFLLASPDAPERWSNHLAGDEAALPAKENVSTQGVQRNLAVMQAWKFDATPLTVYKSRTGEIKIVRGRAQDLSTILADLPPRG